MASVPMTPGVKTVRFQAPREVELPNGHVPLINPKDPDHAQVQERWIAHCRQFKLWDETECEAYEEVFQQVCDGLAQISEQKTEFVPSQPGYLAFLRWSTFVLKAPRG